MVSLLDAGKQYDWLQAVFHICCSCKSHSHSPIPATNDPDVLPYTGRCGTCSLKELLVLDKDAFPESASIPEAAKISHLLLNKAPSTQVKSDKV